MAKSNKKLRRRKLINRLRRFGYTNLAYNIPTKELNKILTYVIDLSNVSENTKITANWYYKNEKDLDFRNVLPKDNDYQKSSQRRYKKGKLCYSHAFDGDVKSDAFLRTFEWRRVRYLALQKSNGRCELCGRSAKDGIILNVDHIKPRRRHPELALDINNLQVLCNSCNHGKGNIDDTDWREVQPSNVLKIEDHVVKTKLRKKG